MTLRLNPKHAFTLIELLTVLAIIAVLAGITITVVGQVRSAGHKAKLTSNLRAAQTGLLLYVADHKNIFPGSSSNDVTGLNVGTENSWHAAVSPYAGEAPKSMTQWRGNTTITQSVFHDPLDNTVTTASGRPTRNIAINGINSVGASAMGVVNRRLATITGPSRLMALTTGIPAEVGDEYAGGMRVSNSYYFDAEKRKQFTRIPGKYFCAFVDGHVEVVPEDKIVEEALKSAASAFFDPAATNGSGR